MCGIAGIIDKSGFDRIVSIQKMIDSLKHRGPDAEGIWYDKSDGVYLGHRRLSIIDLSEKGKQPMHYLNNRYTITFNGEIYNYIELKSKLQENGYFFQSESDTEVLLALYDNKGTQCLSDIDGMFAFAIWDNYNKKLFCARDRFGEKPFFYYLNAQTFGFASEMKALWAIGIPKKLKLNRVNIFLNNNKVYDPIDPSSTFYEEIIQIPNGCYLIFDAISFKAEVNRYYYLPITKNNHITFEEAKGKFFDLFKSSVYIRLRSDVPIGTGLSGGLDSSSIVAMINLLNNNKSSQNTFSARFQGFEYDEGNHINSVLNKYPNILHHEVWPNADEFGEIIDKLVYHQEEPFGSTSIYAQWKVMEKVKNSNVKVLLDGQGSDECLAGYLYYYIRRLYFLFCTNYKLFHSEKEHYYKLRNSDIPFKSLHTVKTNISGWLKRNTGYKSKELLDLDELLLKDCMHGNLLELLRYGDRNSMAHSVEVRAPFLSHHLVEFIFSLPDEFKLNKGWTKYVLRSAMENYLPQEITWRIDKIGYETPQNKFIENAKPDKKFDEFLNDSKIQITNPLKWNNYILSKFI